VEGQLIAVLGRKVEGRADLVEGEAEEAKRFVEETTLGTKLRDLTDERDSQMSISKGVFKRCCLQQMTHT